MLSLLILQLENRQIDPLQTFLQYNKKTTERSNVKYVFIQDSKFHVPPYWQKVFELDNCMTDNPNIQYFMWLDSDAFLVNFTETKMLQFLEKYQYYSVIITRDMPPWDYNEFNAGVFIVKNDDMGRRIMKDWKSKYNPKNWTYTNSKWTTSSQWAGVDYEQGSFVEYILTNPKYANHIIQLPYYVLNNNDCDSDNIDETIAVHLAGKFKSDAKVLNSCMSKFISEKEGFESRCNTNNKNDYIERFLLFGLFIVFIFIIRFLK